MYSAALLLSATALLLDTVSAHGYLTGLNIKGSFVNGSDPVWYYFPANSRPQTIGWDARNQDIGFVEPAAAGTADVNCHKSATAGRLYANVNAGDSIEFVWSGWPVGHTGPVINYIAPCNGDCTTLTPDSLRWSKVSENGLSAGVWGTDTLIKNGNKISMTVPKNLKAGNYVLRHEIIALHGGGSDNGAQLYPQCVNIKVGGSGTVAPTNGVPGTSFYKRTDPGIKFNLYIGSTTYPVPGPALWTAAN